MKSEKKMKKNFKKIQKKFHQNKKNFLFFDFFIKTIKNKKKNEAKL